MRQKLVLSVLFVFLSFVYGDCWGQSAIQVEGYVRDSVTNKALPDVSVGLRGTAIGTATAANGYYSIRAASDSAILVFSCIGYETKIVSLRRGMNRIDAHLIPISYELDEVTVRVERERYSRRENPAVEFVQNIIARRDRHDPKEKDYFSYNTYEQRTFAFDDFDVEKARQQWIFRQFDFIFDYVDSTSVRGRTI
jgi:hypothetical protein